MKVTDSYWAMLPEEVQIHIWDFKLCQEYLDELRRKQWRKLCQEIEQYGKLKEKWGVGFVHLC